MLQKALNRTIAIEGQEKRTARKRVIAENVAQAVVTGRVRMPDGTELELSPKDWMEFTKWLYAHIDGAPKQEVEHTGEGGGDIILKVIYENARTDNKAQEAAPKAE